MLWRDSRILLKLSLLGEMVFYGLYVVMTRNIFILYLVSVGMEIPEISIIIFLSTLVSTSFSIIIYKKYAYAFLSRIRETSLFFHALEKLIFIPVPYFSNPVAIILCYSIANISSIFSSIYVNFIIYGSFEEAGIKDITAKRAMALNVTNVLGYLLTMLLMYTLPVGVKFQIIFILGGLLGMFSTISIITVRMESVDTDRMFGQTKPEQMFPTSSFFITLLTSANLLGLVWTPFLVNVLNSPDYIVVAVNFAGSLAATSSSILWAKASFRKLRYSLGFASLTPVLAMVAPYPLLHVGVSAYGGFTFTGANFLGNFLFARYKMWLGVLRVSILLTIISNVSQLLAALFGLVFQNNYSILFISSTIIRLLSIVIAYFTIAEIAVVPEEYARTYSQLLYANSIVGYSVIVDTIRESTILSLKVLAIATAMLILYVLYRFMFFLMGIS